MFDKYTYLFVNFFCFLFPFIFSFHPKILFNKQIKKILVPYFFVAIFFIIWDIVFTHLQVWAFNQKYVCGIFVFNLPIEECLFFFCIPYSCVFTYHCFKLFFNFSELHVIVVKYFTYTLQSLLLICAGLHYKQLYTSVTFALLFFVLVYALHKYKKSMPLFYYSYALLLIPFFISNGVLTGGFFNKIVVSYNPIHYMGIRLYTIPLEDVFYGMLMMLLNVLFLEQKNKKIRT